ncbi:PREDICTED: penicillin-binding protein 4-like [Priapulus caudatus]|uniref:Penicillin-binding protein 4-like n=1 Tax=Priapulus caudatus TaxID=37621 RepID=A0ABM1F467_PRICU|nr:PREDICTED: penicillin-binding protein 4-like [Priapulus caudatus]
MATSAEVHVMPTIFCIDLLTRLFKRRRMLGRRNLTWDTPVRHILGEEFELCDDMRTQQTSLRDILAHKVGIPGYFGGFLTGFNMTRRQLIRKLRHLPASHPFRTHYIYNNYMYMLAGYIAEAIDDTGSTWEQLVRSRIFRPLRMTSAVFVDTSEHRWEGFAMPHIHSGGATIPIDPEALFNVAPGGAAGSICTNIIDMTKWVRFHLGTGATPGGEQLVDSTLLADTHTEQFNIPLKRLATFQGRPEFPVAISRFAYDLGWTTGLYRGYERVYHGGNIFGYDSQLWLLPGLNAGIVVLTNGPNDAAAVRAIETILYYTTDLLAGETTWLNATTACSFPAPWGKVGAATAPPDDEQDEGAEHERPLADYVGRYGHYGLGSQEIDTAVYFRSSSSSASGSDVTQLVIPWMSPDVETVFLRDLDVDAVATATGVALRAAVVCVVVVMATVASLLM